jgi:hypothetical protein
MLWVHVAFGVFAAVLLPGLSWLDGNGTFAWTMFSKSETFRIGVLVTTTSNEKRYVPPATLAPWASPTTAGYLRASRDWLHSPVGFTFRTSLADIAALGCNLPEAREVLVTLQERKDLDAPVRATEARWVCAK